MSGSIEYSFQYKSQSGLVIDPDTLVRDLFFGVKMCTPTGQPISNQTIEGYIEAAQKTVEEYLNIKLYKECISENQEFVRDDWKNWGMVRSTYPVKAAYQLDGFVGTVRQIQYPVEWLTVRKSNDGQTFRRSIFMVPNQGGQVNQGAVVYSGITPHMGFMGLGSIPNYWTLTYITGFDKIPANIIKAVSYIAAIPIYMVLSNGIIKPGLTSESISIDGLSQSRSTESGGYNTRIKQLQENLFGTNTVKGLLNQLRDSYFEFEFTSV